MIKIENVSKTYKHRRGAKVEALDGITFDLPDKGMVFILGPSGSGKSTLLNILGGLDDFDGGDVVFRGKSFKNFKEHDRNAYRNSVCGFIFQDNNLIPELTVGENVALALELQGRKQVLKQTDKSLSSVGLGGYSKRKINTLSGGQKQRVAIARATAKNPEIIFADEPTGALDEATGKDILTLLKGLSRDRLVVVVSHDRKFAEEFGDRIIELADGKIECDSAPHRCAADNADASRLPSGGGLKVGTALKLGIKNFAKHPLRLATTIFLSVVCFLLLGLSFTIGAFDKTAAFVEHAYAINAETAAVYTARSYTPDNISGTAGIIDSLLGNSLTAEQLLNAESLRERTEDITGSPAAVAYGCQISGFQHTAVADMQAITDLLQSGRYDDHMALSLGGFIEADERLLKELGYDVKGSLPAAADEVAIPECLLNTFMAGGFKENGARCDIACAEDMIGRRFELANDFVDDRLPSGTFTICGVVDTHCGRDCTKGVYYGENDRTTNEYYHEKLFVCRGYLSSVPAYLLFDVPEDKNAMYELADYIFGMQGRELTTHISIDGLQQFDDMCTYAEVFKNLSLYLGVVFFIFAFLFMCNFTSSCVRGQLKQLGIMRAMGAGAQTCATIYILSSVIAGLAIFALCGALLPLLMGLFNKFVAGMFTIDGGLNAPAAMFGLEFWPYAVLLAACILSAAAGAAAVMLKYRKFTPAEIIRSGRTK